MDDSPEQSKLFVGGVSRETTEETLKDHFSKYGTVVASVIAKDWLSGNPRGFAFVSFSDPSAVDAALQVSHEIGGRTVEVKKAIPRSEQQQSKQHKNNRTGMDDEFRTKKIFVGGLSATLSEEDFKAYFERFGRITDVVVMHDNVTHRPRGFGFITFDSEDAAENVVQNNFHQLNGKVVEVKRAVPKEISNGSTTNGHYSRMGNGRGLSYIAQYQGTYSPYHSRYEFFPSYGLYGSVAGYPYGASSIYNCTYPSGGYFGTSYGIAPFGQGSAWNTCTTLGIQGSPLFYGNTTASYPNYMNGAVRDMRGTTNGYNGMMVAEISRKFGSTGDVQITD